jgi:rhodanese-related sulfurtransferase
MKHISSIELKELLTGTSPFFLVDVREEFEHEDFNIGGTLIPLGDIINHADMIPRDKPVIVYCRKGVRSQIAIQRLEQKFGFDNLVNLQGGMEEWKKSF